MTVTKRENSPFFYSEFTLGKKKYIRSTKTKNKAQAIKIDQQYYLAAIEDQKLSGNKISLKDALIQYQNTKRDNVAHNKAIGRIIEFIEENMDINIQLHQVDNRFLHEFVEKRFELNLQPGTVRANQLVLSGCINLMDTLGYDICPKLKFPTVTVKPTKLRVLSLDEEQRLLAELLPRTSGRGNGPHKRIAQQELYEQVVILIETSCRWNEIGNLKWSQVDLDNKLFSIWRTKTSSASVLPMSNRVYDLLIKKKQTSEWVFPNKTNDGPAVYNRGPFSKACERANIDGITLHSLRHTGITNLTKAGLSSAQIQQISGHSDLKSLQIYQHLQSSDVVELVRNLLNK